jgi:hypothetical protein
VHYFLHVGLLWQVVFTGGPNQPGTTKPEEGVQQPYSVLNCESTRQSILPYVLFLQKIIRRRPFMIKTLENVMRRLLQSLVSFYRFKGFSMRNRFTFEFCFWNLLSCDYASFFSPLWEWWQKLYLCHLAGPPEFDQIWFMRSRILSKDIVLSDWRPVHISLFHGVCFMIVFVL